LDIASTAELALKCVPVESEAEEWMLQCC